MILSALALGACSVLGVRSADEPGFTVVDRLPGGVEVRAYPERAAAEITVEAGRESDGRSAAFRALAGYIFGGNVDDRKIAMTAPVEVQDQGRTIPMTAPVEVAGSGEGRYRMRFFLPADVTAADAPRPLDDRIMILAVPGGEVAVRRFSGGTGRARVDAEGRQLLDALAGSAWQPAGEVVAWFYDPPWTLPFLRRNEVVVAVTAQGPSPGS